MLSSNRMIDEALLELDEIDAQITGYRMQLNVSFELPVFIGPNGGKLTGSRRSLTISHSSSPRTAGCKSRHPTRKRYWTSSASYCRLPRSHRKTCVSWCTSLPVPPRVCRCWRGLLLHFIKHCRQEWTQVSFFSLSIIPRNRRR